MKRFAIFWLAAGLTLCLGACRGEPMATPTPQITEPPEVEVIPKPTPEPTPTPVPEPIYTGPWPDIQVPVSLLDLSSYEGELSREEWEALQGFFPVLNNEVPMLATHLSSGAEGVTPTEEVFFRDIYEAYAPKVELPSNYHLTMSFTLTPIVGEKPDLTFAMDGLGGWYLLIHREGERFYAVYMPIRWFEMLQTDGLYLGSGGAATAYYYRLRFSEGTFTEELLANTDWGEWNEDGSYSGYYAIGGIQVTEAEFEIWREDILTKDAVWYPARVREPDSLEPWQESYMAIILHPEEHKEFYAVAEHVPSDSGRSVERIMNEDEPYYFAVWDVNEDGMPELLLGYGQHYGSPRVLLNILQYNEETGQIEDLDGIRTYPLMDSLHFYSNGFFDTHNSAGGLYTECWRLDDEEPDHYWYGYERSAQFNGDGELISVEESPFYSSDGEKYTLQEYYELRGERIIDPFWQENTKERALAALLIVTGTEN